MCHRTTSATLCSLRHAGWRRARRFLTLLSFFLCVSMPGPLGFYDERQTEVFAAPGRDVWEPSVPLGCLVASVRGAHPLLHYPCWYFWYSDSAAKPQARSRTPLCWMWWEQGSERGICIQENLPHYLLSMKSHSSGVGWGLGVLGSAPSVPPSTGGCFSQGLGRARG